MAEEGTITDTGTETVIDVPVEIVNEILSKLPVKSLLRFKSVCKLWNSIINSREFIRKHLAGAHSTQHKKFLGLGIPSSIASSQCVMYEENLNGHILAKRFNFPYQFPDAAESNEQKLASVGNYSDGLICFNMHHNGILIWNPSLPSEYKLIRPPHLASILSSAPSPYIAGMGYDSINDDYKIVCLPNIISFRESLSVFGRMTFRESICSDSFVEVFSMKSNSWKKKGISENFGSGFEIPEPYSGLYTKNRMHWVGQYKPEGEYSYTQVIMYFDMEEENLGYVNSPLEDYGCRLMTYKDSIAVFDREGLWVLQDYRGMNSLWNRVVLRWNIFTYNYSLCCKSNGDIVLHTTLGLLTYDAKDGEIKRSVIEGDEISHTEIEYPTYTSPYVESLVSPRWLQ